MRNGGGPLPSRLHQPSAADRSSPSLRTRRLFYVCILATMAYVCYSGLYVSRYTKNFKNRYRRQSFSEQFMKEQAFEAAADEERRLLARVKSLVSSSSKEQVDSLRKRLRAILDEEGTYSSKQIGRQEASNDRASPIDAGRDKGAKEGEQGGSKEEQEKDGGGEEAKEGGFDPLWWTGAEFKDATPLTEDEREMAEDKANTVKCREWKSQYKVMPGSSWGELPVSLQQEWLSINCDQYLVEHKETVPSADCTNVNPDLANKEKIRKELPLIAIMAAATTRNVQNLKLRKLALFTHLLPSIVRTVECSFRYRMVVGYDKGDTFYDTSNGQDQVFSWFNIGFRYRTVVGYDKGDTFYDTANGRDQGFTWFNHTIQEPLAKINIPIDLMMVSVDNQVKKPGPVFLEMARAAYNEGADYFYRVNDDTEFLNPWSKKFVKALKNMGPPYGAVGPLCRQGNTKILTHDFTHRLHMDIFKGNYYPPELTDWWMDDWIARTYGSSRTRQSQSIEVIHHTGAHGQRYQVDHSHAGLLDGLVQEGRQKILEWMEKNGATAPEKEEFHTARFDKFPLTDIQRRRIR